MHEERDVHLRAQLAPDETVVAAGPQGFVTDRRILFAWRLNWPPHAGEWTHDAISFGEVTSWALGRLHDERPVLRLTHPPHVRLEWAPAHHVLWMRWGNRTAPARRSETTFEFREKHDPLLPAMTGPLQRSTAARREPFVVPLPGARASRTRGSTSGFIAVPDSGVERIWWRTQGRLARLDDRLHNGQIAWPIRVGSWLIVAIPAWFIRPWLSLVAIAAVEVAWVAGLQWSARRDRRRRAARTGS